jgi:ELWxxDGT repeat protein
VFKSFKLRHKSNSADTALPLNGVEELEDRLLLAGNVELLELVPGAFGSVPAEFTDINQKLFFSAFSIGFGKELWLSDGTLAGTAMLKDILPGGGSPGQTGGSYPHVLTQVGPLLLFSATGGPEGDELWASDGTSANTILLKDINAGGGSGITEIAGLGPLGGRAVISAFDDRLGVGGKELWITDGTSGGTFQLRNINPFFNAINSDDGITDRTPYSSFPQDFTNVGGNIFFSARDQVTRTAFGGQSINSELWFTDGTNNNNSAAEAKGTFKIEINPDPDVGSYPQDLINHKGLLFFTADDGGPNGRQVWRTNGTTAGTIQVTNVPGGFNPRNLSSILGEVYFTADGGEGFEPWKTSVAIQNSTALGAISLGDVNPGPASSNPDQFTGVGNQVFFAAYNATVGKELWVTDGTSAGTVLVRDINDEPSITVARGSDPENLINFNGKLFFTAYTVDQGVELWRSDGTTKGTVIFADINTKTDVGQPVGSYPAYAVLIRGVLYFRANDGITGDEFYKLGPLALATDIDDVINIKVLDNKLSVEINGNEVLYNLDEPLTIDALDGVDTVNVILKDEDESVVFSEGLLTVTGENYSFAVSNAEYIKVDAGLGDDTATFNDTSKDDLFVASPGTATMSGSGYSHMGVGFESTNGVASTGKDRAILNGSNDNDTFTGKKTKSVLSGLGYYSSAQGFDRVDANALDGTDTARLYDSTGNDTYRGSDEKATLSGIGFSNTANGFDKILAFASGGKDSAYLKGTKGDDRFNATSSKATLSAAAISQVVKRFERVIATSNGGKDTAVMKDSSGNDKFIGKESYSLLTGAGFYNRANGFVKVVASSSKGNDKLVLADSKGNDTLTAKFGSAKPSVLLKAATFSVKATGFKTNIVSASQGKDVVKLFDSGKNDSYVGLKDTGKLSTPIGDIKVKGFDRVIATANKGGTDRIKNNKLTYTFVQKGSWEIIV